jgi:hypothetical protein
VLLLLLLLLLAVDLHSVAAATTMVADSAHV